MTDTAGNASTATTNREVFYWFAGDPAAESYSHLGQALSADAADLFRHPRGGGLLRLLPLDAEQVELQEISSGKHLWPILVDRLNIVAIKADGKPSTNGIPQRHLDGTLHTDAFLGHFLPVHEVVRVATFLAGEDFPRVERGYNESPDGRNVLYLGPEPEIRRGTETIDRFLDVMEWDSTASRTNAVAAALTVMLRRHWPGAKPVLLVTASKSHAGKDTTIDFAVGEEISSGGMAYQATDWAVEQTIAGILKRAPETAVVHFNNARLGARQKVIASGFIERFATDPSPIIHSTKQREPLRLAVNDKVIAISTNEGTTSDDLLNRSLPIHLEPHGDVHTRRTPIGDPKEYVQANKGAIAAELKGMIEAWKEAGMPLDHDVRHNRKAWAETIGGILQLAGYQEFLANYGKSKTADDPLRSGLAILGAEKHKHWHTATDLVRHVIRLGLVQRVIPPADRENAVAMARGLGKELTAHAGEVFEFADKNSGKKLRLRLERSGRRRWTDYDRKLRRYP